MSSLIFRHRSSNLSCPNLAASKRAVPPGHENQNSGIRLTTLETYRRFWRFAMLISLLKKKYPWEITYPQPGHVDIDMGVSPYFLNNFFNNLMTPPKTNILNPRIGGLYVDVSPFSRGYFQVPCYFSGVYQFLQVFFGRGWFRTNH